MAKSPEEQAATMIANLKANTGKTLEQWVAIAKKSGEEKHGGVVKHLKAEHGLTHGFANLVAHKYLKSDAGSAESVVSPRLRTYLPWPPGSSVFISTPALSTTSCSPLR